MLWRESVHATKHTPLVDTGSGRATRSPSKPKVSTCGLVLLVGIACLNVTLATADDVDWIQIIFTGLIPSKKEMSGIKRMGGSCVEDPNQATHVVCEKVIVISVSGF